MTVEIVEEKRKPGRPRLSVDPVSVDQEDNVYTYVGSGPDIPEVCNFMGIQRFVRFEPVQVTDKRVLAKIKNHSCFVKGEPDKAAIFERDEAERKRVELQRAVDKQKNDEFAKRSKKYK